MLFYMIDFLLILLNLFKAEQSFVIRTIDTDIVDGITKENRNACSTLAAICISVKNPVHI